MIFLVQTMLNVFGPTDLLPLTGVTLPFVSCGGSSMMSCWCLLAYIKAADTRQNAGIAVRLPKRSKGVRSSEPAVSPIPDIPDHPFRSAQAAQGRQDTAATQPLGRFDTRTGLWDPDGFSAELSIHVDDEDSADWEDEL